MDRGFVALALAMSLFLFSCTSKTNAPAGLSVQLEDEPATLDWHRATDIPSRTVILTLMATLTDYSFEGDQPKLIPGLAESWKSNAEHTVWTFKLREDLKWSDGKPFTADQVVASFKRLLSPETGAFNSYYFYPIQNAEAFNKGEIEDFSAVGVKAVDAATVKFELDQSVVYFPKLLALFNTAPWREDFKVESDNLVIEASTPVLGPYRVTSLRPGQWIRLEANPHYYGEPAKIKKLEFRILKEPATALNLYQSGRLDIVTKVPESEKAALKHRQDYVEVPELSIEYVGFNHEETPFNQKSYRQKLAQATDTQALVELLDSGETVNPYFIPEGVVELPVVSKAGEMEKDIETGVDVTLTFPADARQKRLAEALQAQWKKNLGWEVELQPQDWKVFLGRVNSEPPQLYRLGWMAIYPDPILFLSVWTSDSHYNTSGWADKKYDRLVEKIRAEASASKRKDLVHQALQILKQEVVMIPLYRGARQYLVSETLTHYRPNSLNRPQFAQIGRISSDQN